MLVSARHHSAAPLLHLRSRQASPVTVLQENVDMMSSYMDLSRFKAIYVVDLCHSLCEVARKKVAAKGWQNVHVVEGDACRFRPKTGLATLVTFSYSLSSELWDSLPRIMMAQECMLKGASARADARSCS